METNTNRNSQKPSRVSYPADEKRYTWLAILLDAYFVIDQGVDEAIRREMKKGQSLACRKGCSSCCITHEDIPVYPLELMGISWFVIEKMEPISRMYLQQRLSDVQNVKGCPFLLDSVCSIHPLRPIACRQFNVLNTACAGDEDAYHSRREDVITPISKYTDQAFDIMLPFYGVKDKAARTEAIRKGALHALARAMRECHWHSLPEKMTAFDKSKSAR